MVDIMILIFILIFCLIIFIGVIFVSIPAMCALPAGIRPGIEDLAIDDAIEIIKRKKLNKHQIVEESRILIITRMKYCRRNSYDSFRIAFRRGYGYCIQQAQALAYILRKLGFNADVIQSTRNKFKNGKIGGHAWVRVLIDGAEKQIDASGGEYDDDTLTFTPLSRVTELKGLFLWIALWGSGSVNAIR
jgi:hypothetical protein